MSILSFLGKSAYWIGTGFGVGIFAPLLAVGFVQLFFGLRAPTTTMRSKVYGGDAGDSSNIKSSKRQLFYYS